MEKITRTRHQWPHRQLEAKLWPLGSLLQPLSSQRSWKAVRHISSLSQLGLHDRFHKFHSEILWFDSVRSQNFLRPGIQTTKKWLDVKWLQLKVGDFRIPDLKNHNGNHPKKYDKTSDLFKHSTLNAQHQQWCWEHTWKKLRFEQTRCPVHHLDHLKSFRAHPNE